MMQQNYVDLARSLRVGSVVFASVAVELVPGSIVDENYHRYRVEASLQVKSVNGDPEYWPTYAELRDRFQRCYTPAVVEWRP